MAGPPPPFTPDATVLVDGYDITASPPDEHGFGEAVDFLVRRRDGPDTAWARWVGAPGLLRGRARIVALRCVHCAARTGERCCDAAMCAAHLDHHRAVDHSPPGGDRYRALLAAPLDLVVGSTAEPAPVPGLRLPRDHDLPPAARPRKGDALKVLHHVRRVLLVPGVDDDPVGDVLRTVAAGDAILPDPARTRALVAHILGRCAWPAFCDAFDRQDAADWLRRQPIRRGTAPRKSTVDVHGPADTPVTRAGEVAARDALCGLWPTAPDDLGGGLLGSSGRLGAAVFSNALALPGGPDRVGHAVRRAQRDAVAAVVAVLTGRATPSPVHDAR
ncbi:hypothetical protein [Umezawaea sp. Da 62-37]|uniref:hypothetical protein n=1 Tax=Umezawaea sp. Da 62-37 TaxID=3075927 RepID=UPI0028F6F3CC|nr:hypothetical protein [Umezawaea sp. Da 62-37]WNV85843.1 hypothetical protein RM788_48320 [Umezawaea sp. Da 62-37]